MVVQCARAASRASQSRVRVCTRDARETRRFQSGAMRADGGSDHAQREMNGRNGSASEPRARSGALMLRVWREGGCADETLTARILGRHDVDRGHEVVPDYATGVDAILDVVRRWLLAFERKSGQT